jgi:hypothetical protein
VQHVADSVRAGLSVAGASLYPARPQEVLRVVEDGVRGTDYHHVHFLPIAREKLDTFNRSKCHCAAGLINNKLISYFLSVGYLT